MINNNIRITKGISIGDGHRVFIIGEAGSNWRMGNYSRDIQMAKTLIDIATEAGCDAIKFQTYRSDKLYVKNAGQSRYLSKHGISQNINSLLREFEMPYEMLNELASYCNKKNILFMSTPFSIDCAKHVNKFVKIHKIASYEITHFPLIEYIASTKKPIILSTGASDLKNIDMAAKFLKKLKAKFCLMQCTAKYPAPPESLNLRAIKYLKEKYKMPIGLSDHSLHPTLAPTAAVAIGANLIEKHFTIDRRLPGPDHAFAIEPNELSEMVRAIRWTEKALGNEKKEISNYEKELKDFAVRGIQAIKDIKKGDILKLGDNIDILRPGSNSRGEHPAFLDKIEGKKANRNIKAGDGIKLKYVTK